MADEGIPTVSNILSSSKKNLSDAQRQRIIEVLLESSTNGILEQGAITKAAAEVKCNRKTVGRLWKTAKEQLDRGEAINVKSKMQGRVAKKPLEVSSSKMAEIPLHQKSTIRSLAKVLEMSKSSVHRLVQKGEICVHNQAIKPFLTSENMMERIDTMKRPNPWNDQVDLISSDDDSDSEVKIPKLEAAMKILDDIEKKTHAVEKVWDDDVTRRAAIYQDHMNQIPIPTMRGSVIPCNSWVELGKSIKALYGQPLHYLTNVLLKEWDKARLDTDDGDQPLDLIIHPAKAETSIWLMEEVHRYTTSYTHIANLWRQEKMYYAFIDPDFPPLSSSPSCKLEPV